MATLHPTEDRILVRAVPTGETTPAGLYIPPTARDRPYHGTVIAVGPGRLDTHGRRIPPSLTVGQTVIYSRYAGAEVTHDGQPAVILSALDVLATLPADEDDQPKEP